MRLDRRAALAIGVVGLWLAMATPAAGKFTHELRIGEDVSIQGEIAPTLFAGRPCVEVVPRVRGDGGERTNAGFTEVEAGREYWMLVFFRGDERPAGAPPPRLLLRNLATGASVQTEAKGNLPVRFPYAGPWAVSIADGPRTFEFSSGRVFANGAAPAELLDPVAHLDPVTCATESAPATAPAAASTPGPPVAIAGAVVLIAGIGLLLRWRRRPGSA